jgi:tetratricopeptide (TPR) repeat protein
MQTFFLPKGFKYPFTVEQYDYFVLDHYRALKQKFGELDRPQQPLILEAFGTATQLEESTKEHLTSQLNKFNETYNDHTEPVTFLHVANIWSLVGFGYLNDIAYETAISFFDIPLNKYIRPVLNVLENYQGKELPPALALLQEVYTTIIMGKMKAYWELKRDKEAREEYAQVHESIRKRLDWPICGELKRNYTNSKEHRHRASIKRRMDLLDSFCKDVIEVGWKDLWERSTRNTRVSHRSIVSRWKHE